VVLSVIVSHAETRKNRPQPEAGSVGKERCAHGDGPLSCEGNNARPNGSPFAPSRGRHGRTGHRYQRPSARPDLSCQSPGLSPSPTTRPDRMDKAPSLLPWWKASGCPGRCLPRSQPPGLRSLALRGVPTRTPRRMPTDGCAPGKGWSPAAQGLKGIPLRPRPSPPPAPGRDRPGTGSDTGPPPKYLGHFPNRHRTLYQRGSTGVPVRVWPYPHPAFSP
jgi:hypothetical protein